MKKKIIVREGDTCATFDCKHASHKCKTCLRNAGVWLKDYYEKVKRGRSE